MSQWPQENKVPHPRHGTSLQGRLRKMLRTVRRQIDGWTDLGELATNSCTPVWNSSFNPREYRWRRFGVLPGYRRLKDAYST